MGEPRITSLNGAAGNVIRNGSGEVAQHRETGREQQPSASRSQTRDQVEHASRTNTTVPLETRVAQLERQLQLEREQRMALETRVQDDAERARQAKADEIAAQREDGWVKKGLMDLMMLFLRMFSPMISLISLIVRALRIAYKVLIEKEKMTADDWKREGMLFLADLAGAAPMVGMLAGPVGFLSMGPLTASLGGVVSAGIHGAVKVTSEDKDDMLGWEKQEPSGLRIGWEKLRELGGETYAAVTGRERPSESRATEESGIDTRPVAPADIPLI